MSVLAEPLAPMQSSASSFTLGVEEELFVVDPGALAPVACGDAFFGPVRFARGRIVPETCDGVVELVTPVCTDAGGAVGALGALRREVMGRAPVALIGAGVHPTLAFGDVWHRRGSHYEHVSDQTRSLLRQSTYCGVHVHVGMPDPETAIVAFNGMRKWIPVLQALSANSPFWHGIDSGLASSRTVVCHSVPRTGLPRAFHDWQDFAQTIDELCRVAEVPSAGSVWWDMRPHPTLGTLEIRCLDAQSSLRDLGALAALVHVLVYHEALIADSRHPPVEILQEATYRALRDGLDATLSLGGPLRPVRDLARHALDLAAGYAPTLAACTQLSHLERMLTKGNGAVRQRRAFARGGIPAVLEQLRDETMQTRSVALVRSAPMAACPDARRTADPQRPRNAKAPHGAGLSAVGDGV
jgi:glutamate---cysteine ligase / carboxylate-amine ligase